MVGFINVLLTNTHVPGDLRE